MRWVIYWLGSALVAFLQALPLTWVARLGRAGGALAYWLDARHRRVTLKNLTMCFGSEKSPDEIRALAKENFRRIGENYASAVKTIAMTFDELRLHVEFVGAERLLPPRRVINAGGHFGNFELYARFNDVVAGYQSATTYRALNQPGLNRLMEKLRNRSDCLFLSGAPAARCCAPPCTSRRSSSVCRLINTAATTDCACRFSATIVPPTRPRRSSPCVIIANFTPQSVIAWDWPNGAWNWVK